MSHCVDFFKAWKKKGNFCGISKEQAKLIESYIAFVSKFSKSYGFDEDIVFQNVQPTAIKPLLRFTEGSANRIAAEKHIYSTLKSHQSPTAKTIEKSLGMRPLPKHAVDSGAVKKEISVPMVFENGSKNAESEKNRLFLSVLTTGQIRLWREYAEKHKLESEYAALSKVTTLLKDL